jgi:hypothetical protein
MVYGLGFLCSTAIDDNHTMLMFPNILNPVKPSIPSTLIFLPAHIFDRMVHIGNVSLCLLIQNMDAYGILAQKTL